MSVENVKKLELGIDMTCNCEKYSQNPNLTRKEMQPFIDEGMNLVEEAMQSGEIGVLARTFDYFLEESTDNGLGNGVCESLFNQIFRYYSLRQIIKVLYKKFDSLLEVNIIRAVQFFGACMNTGHFAEIKKIFDNIKTDKSEEFLKELEEWYIDDYPEEIALLIKDMREKSYVKN